jgi:acyl-CoA thioester hydrolase
MAWAPMSDRQAPLRLHQARVLPQWVDYNGHMNEAYYVLVFGDATDAFYDHVGFDAAFRETHHVSAYTLESHISYLIETREGESLAVATQILGYDRKRVRLHHSMFRGDTEIVAVIELLALHVDKAALKAAPFHPAPMARIAAIGDAHAVLPPPRPAMSGHWLSKQRKDVLF